MEHAAKVVLSLAAPLHAILNSQTCASWFLERGTRGDRPWKEVRNHAYGWITNTGCIGGRMPWNCTLFLEARFKIGHASVDWCCLNGSDG
eukprot:scaffold840_cov344-Pavlova_lutheri.AAC.65